jgi:protein-tyrosine phosphatase
MSEQGAWEGLHNFRDLGGHRTQDGRTVCPGRLYRSDSLAKLRGSDLSRFRALGVRTVIDLRYPFEIAARGRVYDGPHTYHNLSIEHRPYDQTILGPEVEPARYLADRYAEVLADGVVELRSALRIIAAPPSAPLVFHCASGKDRTGIVAALVLTLLGVADADIVADFARTGSATQQLVAAWHADHPGRTLRWPAYAQAPAELMENFLAETAAEYGSLRSYALDHLELGDGYVETLRAHLLA